MKYHRTLTTYLDTLLTGGFSLRRVGISCADRGYRLAVSACKA